MNDNRHCRYLFPRYELQYHTQRVRLTSKFVLIHIRGHCRQSQKVRNRHRYLTIKVKKEKGKEGEI